VELSKVTEKGSYGDKHLHDGEVETKILGGCRSLAPLFKFHCCTLCIHSPFEANGRFEAIVFFLISTLKIC
jgi:hypothetical protein